MPHFYDAKKALPAPGRIVCGMDEREQLWLVTHEGNALGEPRWSHAGFVVAGIVKWAPFENVQGAAGSLEVNRSPV